MRLPKGLTLALLLIAVLLFIPAPVFAEQDLPDPDSSTLFTDFIEIDRHEHLEIVADSIDLPELPQTAAKRIARVGVEETIKKARSMARGQTIIIDLFDDETLMAKIDRVETVNQVDSVRAQVEDSFFGFMILSAYDDKALIVIELPDQNKQYQVVYNHLLESHYLYEYNLDEIYELMPAPPLIPPDTTAIDNEVVHEEIRIPETERPSREAPQRSEETAAASPADVMAMTEPTESERLEREIAADQSIAEIDVMIVYTPAAKSWASTYATSIHHVMNQAMEIAQFSLDNSFLDQDHALINMNLVHSGEINYTESGCINTDLDRLTFGTYGFAQVHQWRDQHGADLVALFPIQHHYGGIGWILNNPAGQADFGFSITNVQQAHNTYTHIHEMGHNMGAHHHKAQNFQPGPGLYSYSAGWRWVMPDGTRFCDLMTYEEGVYFADGYDHARVAIFSNPNVYYGGVSTGDSVHGDNARTIREVRHVIAGYRAAMEDAELVIQSLTVEPSPAQLGTELTATIVVKNEGSTGITQAFWLDIYEHRESPPAPFEDGDDYVRVEGLPAGSTITFTYEFTPNSEGTFKFWAQVDSYMEVSDNPHVFGPVAYIVGEEEPEVNLIIQSLTVEPSPSQLGTELTATIVVKNEGSTDITQAFWLDIYEHRESPPAPFEDGDSWARVEGLPAGATVTITHKFTPNSEGTFKFWAQVDSYMEVSDNPHVFGPVEYIVGEEEPEVNLIIQSLTVEPSPSQLGTELTATIVVKNEGSTDITQAFWLDIYEHRESPPAPFEDGDSWARVEGLPAGATVTITHKFTPNSEGTFKFWAQVDSYMEVSDNPHVFGPVEYIIEGEAPLPAVDPDNSSATFTDNKNRTGTMTLIIHDQFDDPMPGFGLADIAVISGDYFEATLETMNNYEHLAVGLTYAGGVYTAIFTYDPGYSQPGTMWDIKVDDVIIEEDMFVSITYEEVGEQIEAVILEKEAGVYYVEVDLLSWAMAFFDGPGDPIYDYVGGGPIVGIRSGARYIDLFSYSEKYFDYGGDFARALAEADQLAQEIIDKTKLYKPSAEALGAIFDPMLPGVWNIIIPFKNAETMLGATKADKLELLQDGVVVAEMEYREREEAPQESFVAFAVQNYTLEEVRAFRVRIK